MRRAACRREGRHPWPRDCSRQLGRPVSSVGGEHGERETIRIVWLRDGQEAAAFQRSVSDAETASRLFDRLVAILQTGTAEQGRKEKQGGR